MSSFSCPRCGNEQMNCKDSRPSPVDGVVRRRRYECPACGHRLRTEECVVAEEGKSQIITERHLALMFVREVEASMRRYFGDQNGYIHSAVHKPVVRKK